METTSKAPPFYLGRYNCVEAIGQGPLGETFRAKIYGVAGFEKQFAVKRLPVTFSKDETIVRRFVTAATDYAALSHERIGRVHEVNVQGSQYYLAVDLVRGLDLGRVIEQLAALGERLSRQAILLIGLELAEALSYAHGRVDLQPQGVLHLGLSPRAVMLTQEGEVRLLDFGLLHALRGRAPDDTLMPAFAYSAPELLRTEFCTPQSDVFSLGALLWELSAGHRPFWGDSAQAVREAIEAGQCEPLEQEPAIVELVGRCLKVSAEDRFATAGELAIALRQALGDDVARARGELLALARRLLGRSPSRTGSFPSMTGTGLIAQRTGPGWEMSVHSWTLPHTKLAPKPELLAEVRPHSVAEPPVPGSDNDPTIGELVAAAPELVAVAPAAPEPTASLAPAFSIPRGDAISQPNWPELPPEAAAAAHVKAELAEAKSRPRSQRLLIPAALALVTSTSAVVFFGPRPVSPPPHTTIVARKSQSQGASGKALETSNEVAKSAELSVVTAPAGATVYLDGEPKGTTPTALPANPGSHKIVLVSHGFAMWRRTVTVKRTGLSVDTRLVAAKLPSEVNGPAGLKVRCRTQNELRIFVDGNDSGVNCPNDQRISVQPGTHKIGLLSPRTEQMHELEQEIVEGNHSTRVYVKY